jgi:hypothetical protein
MITLEQERVTVGGLRRGEVEHSIALEWLKPAAHGKERRAKKRAAIDELAEQAGRETAERAAAAVDRPTAA